jgi:hypothetical protein
LRRAYDYWQDQPGCYRNDTHREVVKPSPKRTVHNGEWFMQSLQLRSCFLIKM